MNDECPFKVGDRVNYKPSFSYIQNEKGEVIVLQEIPSTWPDATIVSIEVNGFTYEYDKPYTIHARLGLVSNGGFVYSHSYDQWQLVKTT